jgi:hypothetical protein
MSWEAKFSYVAKSASTTTIDALTSANFYGNTTADANFAAHLAAAQAAAVAAVAGLTGAATNVDISISVNRDTSAERVGQDAGTAITVVVVERY